MCSREMPELILNQMQIFNQQITADFTTSQKCGDLGARARIDLSALERGTSLLAAANFGQWNGNGDAIIHRLNLQKRKSIIFSCRFRAMSFSYAFVAPFAARSHARRKLNLYHSGENSPALPAAI